MIGLYGKLPSNGDFVRRRLPETFIRPWDAWLQAGIVAAKERLAAEFDPAWAAGPAWRFSLPAGACGDRSCAGVIMPSRDRVGRAFPLTVGIVHDDEAAAPGRAWYDAVADATTAALAEGLGPDALLDRVSADACAPASRDADHGPPPPDGWWLDAETVWGLPELPRADEFHILIQGGV